MTVQPTRDQLLDMTEDLRVLGDRPELCDEVVDGLWAALDRAERRATRAEAQSAIRGRAVAIHRERTREAKARIKAVEALCDRASRDAGVLERNLLGGHRLYPKEIRRALDA